MQTRARLGPVVVTALVAALAGVGALAWFAMSAREDAAAEAGRATRGANRTPVDVAAESTSEAAVSVEATRDDEDASAIPPDELRIVVRRAEDHAPIAGAEVDWMEDSVRRDARELRGIDDACIEEDERFEGTGWGDTTDARGWCIARNLKMRPRDGITIRASHGEQWALVHVPLDPERRSVTVDLSPADVVRVQVLATDGTPLPDVVALFGPTGADPRECRHARTVGRDAIATIRGATAFARLFGVPDATEWGASVLLPLRTRPFTAVDPRKLPTEPVVVRVPACGRMAIALRSRDGQLLRRRAHVTVTGYQRLESTSGASTAPSGPSVSTQLLVAKDGWLELPFVDVGLTLEVTAEVDRSDAGHAFLEGPDAVGERKVASLDVDYGTVKFVGMLVRADDTPAAGERIEFRVTGNRSARVRRSGVLPYEEAEVGEGTTDAQGKYSILVPVVGAGPGSFDCEILVRSATGLDRKLAAIAVVAEKNGDAFMGTLHVPAD